VVCDLSQKRGISLPKILMEPGRSIVAPAGITVYTVGAVKEIPGIRTYISVDGGMCDNPRYILYQSKYTALTVNNPAAKGEKIVTIAGKCCESGDILIKDIKMPHVSSGDLIAVLATGAYNYSMASNYNRIPRPPVVMVRGGKHEIVVARESYEDLIKNDL
jgi:diaminopimelate decarboxylase